MIPATMLSRRVPFAVLAAVAMVFSGLSAASAAEPGSCETTCAQKAEAFLAECLAANGENCEARAAELKQHCIAENCEAPPPPPPPDLTCEDRCELAANDLFARCRGEGLSEGACLEKRAAFFRECVANECNEPPPPPPPPDLTCEERCKLHSEEVRQACIAAGGGADRCDREAREALAACINENCKEPPPPPPPDLTCEERCKLRSEEVRQACIAAGGGADQCDREAREALAACLHNTCNLPPPPEPGCEDRCRLHSREIFRKCIEEGGDERTCGQQAEAGLKECLASCPGMPPPEPTCRERCARAAAEAEAICRGEGGGEDQCHQRAQDVLNRCLGLCEAPPPPPPPGCEDHCRQHAKEVVAACIAAGNGERECAARGEEAFIACARENCPSEPPGEPSCEDRCESHAAEVFQLCIAEGGSEADCKLKAEEAFRNCIPKCAGEPPPQPSCHQGCEERAGRAFRACLDEGGSEAACKERSMAVFRECLASCEQEPPAPPACEDDCAARGREIFQACRDAGGSEEDCRNRADAITSLCLARCGANDSCDDRCAAAARIVLAGCSLGGLPGSECKRLANLVLEGCLGGCEPHPTCQERCDLLAKRAIEECIGLGGGADECAAKGEEVRAGCAEHCEGDDSRPPCNDGCEEKAAAIEAHCLAEGGEPERCAAMKNSFLEECRAQLDANCSREAIAALSPFQAFRRGNANGDDAIDISDSVAILGHLFLGEPGFSCEDAADANDDGTIDISDPIAILSFLFLDGLRLPEPLGRAGQDPTADDLICSP